MRELDFVTDHYYHIYNRGVDKQRIFHSDRDYFRFYKMMYLFNDKLYRFRNFGYIRREVQFASKKMNEAFREPWVDIIAFCILPNHFHFFLRQRIDNGISKFMHKLCMGYGRYFNSKYERTGTLFERRFQAKLVNKESHYQHIVRYVHLNALDFVEKTWREEGIKDWKRAIKQLDAYKWSSHHAYMGRDQILPIVKQHIFEKPNEYIEYLHELESPGDSRKR